MPKALLKKALELLGATKGKSSEALAVRFAARVLCLGLDTVCRCMAKLRAHSWQPQQPAPLVREEACQPGLEACPHPALVDPLEVLVRLALANAVEGDSGQRFERDVERLRLAGVEVGDKCHSRHFTRDVECIASLLLAQLDAVDIQTNLPGLGIPSDFGILLDPVSIGPDKFARHDTTLMLCISIVSGHTQRIYTPMKGGAPWTSTATRATPSSSSALTR